MRAVSAMLVEEMGGEPKYSHLVLTGRKKDKRPEFQEQMGKTGTDAFTGRWGRIHWAFCE